MNRKPVAIPKKIQNNFSHSTCVGDDKPLPAIEYWEDYYSKRPANAEPSQFARFIASRFPDRKNIVDVGCGNGRDSFFFASSGCEVLGVDASATAIRICENRRHMSAGKCSFHMLDVGRENLRDILVSRQFDPAQTLIYARFFLHAISERSEHAFLASVAPVIGSGARLCVEFRTAEDASLFKVENAHYRRFIDPQLFLAKCEDFRMQSEFFCVGKGLAPYGAEDPVIARMVLKGEYHV
jgi:SAM-dependent methyltransferase